MSNDNWNNLCKKKQGCNEDSAIEGLVVKDFAQYEDTYFKAENNFEKSVAEDLQKYYSENHWKVIRELFQVLGFTDIDDRRILSGDTVSESFIWSCESFIEIQNQSLLLFSFKSCAKKIPDLKSAIKVINAIADN
ncbi:3548_t:CDS:2 [Funneliformis geosporum]|nr:3548_t:CDS:2 [Funneliformis geosporum]